MSKKGKARSYYQSSWWDDDDYVGFEPEVRTRVATWGYKKEFTSIFGTTYGAFDWASVYSQSSSRDEIRKMKEKLSEVCNKKYIPIKVMCSNMYTDTTFWRMNRVVLNTNPETLKRWLDSKELTARLVLALSKLPVNSHMIHSRWAMSYIEQKPFYIAGFLWGNNMRAYDDYIVPYFEWSKPYEEVIRQFMNPDESELHPNVWGRSAGEFSGGMEVGNLQVLDDNSTYKAALKMLGKKFVKQSRAEYTESIRGGSRINPNYLNKTSYKPLLVKSIAQAKVPKVMFILDCSGSMGNANGYSKNPSHQSVSFMAAMINGGVCEATHAVYHSDRGWRDMAPRIKKGELTYYGGSGDGFDYIDDNLPSDWVKWVDYVIALTDLEYEENAQWGLLDYLKRAPAHLVLSFKNTPKVDWINAVVVKKVEDMVKAVTKFQSKYI